MLQISQFYKITVFNLCNFQDLEGPSDFDFRRRCFWQESIGTKGPSQSSGFWDGPFVLKRGF